MKKTFLICIATMLVCAGCIKDPVSTEKLGEYQLEFIFEKDGLKVYRFYDNHRYIYFVDGRGSTSYETGGKRSVRIDVETVK